MKHKAFALVMGLSLGVAVQSPAMTIVPVLTDSFEGYMPGPIPTNLPTTFTVVLPPPGAQGDPAAITTGTVNDGMSVINPRTGTQMLRFLQSHHVPGILNAGTNSDVFYLLDLQSFASNIATGAASVHLSAFFNTGAAAIHNAFWLEIRAYAGITPAQFPTAILDPFVEGVDRVHTFNSRLLTDSNAATWQEQKLDFILPSGTDFIAVRIAANENVAGTAPQAGTNYDFRSAFADDVTVKISLPGVPDPMNVPESGSSIVLLSLALVGIVVTHNRVRKSRAA